MRNATKDTKEPRFPSVRRKCKYCGCQFNTKPTYNGSKMKFCKPAHRKAFDKEGEKPIDVILRKQERRMREIAREEVEKIRAELAEIKNGIGGIAKHLGSPVGIIPPVRVSNVPAENGIAKNLQSTPQD